MKDEARKCFERVFAEHEAEKRAETEATEAFRTEAQAKKSVFLDRCGQVIRPTLDEFGKLIKEKGFDYEIAVEDDKIYKAAIQIQMWRQASAGQYIKGAAQTFRIAWEAQDPDNVWVSHPSGPESQSANLPIKEITEDRLNTMLVSALQNLLE